MTEEEKGEDNGVIRRPIHPMLPLKTDTTPSTPQNMQHTAETSTNPNPISLMWRPTLSNPNDEQRETTQTGEDPTARLRPQFVQSLSMTPTLSAQNHPQNMPTLFTPTTVTAMHTTIVTPTTGNTEGQLMQTPQGMPTNYTTLPQSLNPNQIGFANMSLHPPYVPQYVTPWQAQTPPTPFVNPFHFPYIPVNPMQHPFNYNGAQNSATQRSVTSPFAKELLDYEIPNTSNLPTLRTYNGTTDPDSHIDTYEWHMTSLKLDERFWCTYFPTTLDGNAGTWFKTLRPNSIQNFNQLKQLFLTNFMQLRRYRGDNHAIIGCKQKEGESVKDYFKRFTKATLDTPGQDESLVTGAFT